MGAYRSQPITDKVSSDETGKYVKCGASSMQGWRVTQEDAHNCILEYDENTSLFAVYDGHGGHEVAQYCSENLPQYLKECDSYKEGKYMDALKEAFLGFDATLIEPKVVKVLNQIVKSADDDLDGSENPNSGSEDEENIRNLYEEAQMPLEEVMAKYQTDGLNPAVKKLKGGTPRSPYLVAKQSSKLKFSEEACSSKAGSSSCSSGMEPSEESSCESADKDEKNSNGESDSRDSVSNGNSEKDTNEEIVESKSSEQKSEVSLDNGIKNSLESEDSEKKTLEKSDDSSSGKSKTSEVNKGKESKSEDVKKEEASNEMLEEKVKSNNEKEFKECEDVKVQSAESTKDEKNGDTKEIKDADPEGKDSSTKKIEVNGDMDPKDHLKEAKEEPHENGEVADEETEDDEEREQEDKKISPKGKGKAVVKKSDQPKRTSARQRNMAILFHSLLLAQDSADSESDDEGDESFEGAEESSSNEEEEKEAEAEGEDEEEDGGDEEGEEEEEEEEDYEVEGDEDNTSNFAKGPGVESGCTAVVALLHGRDLYVANAGDSRCIVSRSGEALDMSLDHKPEDDIEIDRIAAAGGFVSADGRVNGGLNLSRAVGDHAYKRRENLPPEEQMITALPDVRTLSLEPEKDEFMVLACDGIWNSMTSQEVVNFVRTRLQKGDKKLSEICEELFDFCLAPNTASDGTGCDNMTALIIQFLPNLSEGSSSNLPNTSITTAPTKRPASPSETSDSSAKRLKTDDV